MNGKCGRVAPWRRVQILAALLAVFASTPASAELPKALEHRWVAARSRHFTVFTDLDAKAAVEVARKLELLTEVMAGINPGLEASSPRGTIVFAFRNTADFVRYRHTKVENSTGYFMPDDGANRIVFDASAGAEDGDVLYHEYVHGYLRHNYASLPLWLNEGFATYYSSFEPGARTAEIGRPIRGAREWLIDHPWFTAAELFAIGHDSPHYQGKRRRTFYAQSWALVHYLRHSSDENRARLETLLARLAEGKSDSVAYSELVPPPGSSALMEGVRDYLGRSRLQSTLYQFTRPFDEAEVRVEPMADAEIRYRLGELLRVIGDREGAGEHVRAALTADPGHARSIALLGYLTDLAGRTSEAESLYLAASEVDPREPVVYAHAARGALRRYLESEAFSATPPELQAARVRFGKCLELDPTNLEALIGFGRASRYGSNPSAGAITALRSATRLEPARLDVRADLVHLLARLERCSEADSVYRTIEPSGEPRLLKGAVASLIACRIARADGITAGEGREDPMLGLSSVVTDHAIRDYARAEIAKMRSVPRLERSGLPSSQQPSADFTASMASFNAGLKAANQGDYSGALAHFEKARARTSWKDLIDQIDRASASVRTRMRIRDGIGQLNAGNVEGARSTFRTLLASPLDDSTRAYVEKLAKRADARVAIESGVKMAKRGETAAASNRLDSLSTARIDDDLRAYARALGDQVDTRVEVEKGIAMLKAGRLSSALAHFESLQSSPTSESMRVYIRNLITHTRARLDVARAIDLIEAKRLSEARATLTDVLARPIGSHLRAYVEKIAAQVDAPAQGR